MMTKPNHSRAKKIILFISMIISFLFLSAVLSFTLIYQRYDLDISRLTSLNNGIKVYSSSMIDNTLYNTNRSIVEIDTLPDYVLKAFVDTEDKRFYSHNGYDLQRIVKASMINLTSGTKSQGASTISQQLIKNALLSNEKTYSRKLKELVLSIKMEKLFSKDEILEMYLNTIYFGSNAYGIENASQIYFNKSAKDLTIDEACCLAGIIKAPNIYSPRNNIDKCTNRRNLVAKMMLDAGSISTEQYSSIITSEINTADHVKIDTAYEEEAILEACRILGLNERELINKQYEIVTFKDDALQEKIIKVNNYTLNQYDDLDSISIVADNYGKIRAFYINSQYNLHNIKRQPASILKPLAVYLPCLIYNILTPASQVIDEPVDYNGYTPSNHDRQYHGYISTREAITKSLNIPAVKALDALGIERAVLTLNDLGIHIEESDKNLSLALGGISGVSLLDIVSAYSTIANMGTYSGATFVDKILDKDGNIVYSYTTFSEHAVEPESCYMLTDMLKDAATYGTARRLGDLDIPVASKTGTAFNGTFNTDLYNVAYTAEHTLLTWIADIKHNQLSNKLYSAVEPTLINKAILAALYNDHKPRDFIKPNGVELMPYDQIEYESSHTIIAPTTELERYIAYDYFKTNHPPHMINYKEILNFDVSLNKSGASISFIARNNCNYTIYKTTDDGSIALKQVSDHSGTFSIIDQDVFDYEYIKYHIECNDRKSEIIELRPKDYLINLLNLELLSHKRKWYV